MGNKYPQDCVEQKKEGKVKASCGQEKKKKKRILLK